MKQPGSTAPATVPGGLPDADRPTWPHAGLPGREADAQVHARAAALQVHARAAALQLHYAHIARTRMAGLPLLNARLQVEAVGFELLAADIGIEATPALLGVLVTPWFMNLVWLPVRADDRAEGVGRVRRLELAGQCFEFIGAHEPGLGAHAACSLFSPMDDFGDAASARLTALAVLDLLRPVPGTAAGSDERPSPVQPPLRGPSQPRSQPQPSASRRGFLFGRNALPGAGA